VALRPNPGRRLPRTGAGVAVLALALVAEPGGPARAGEPPLTRTMAVTFDDLPAVPASDLGRMQAITTSLLATLKAHEVTAVAFVNESKVDPPSEREARLDLLRQWLDRGHDLGNHTRSHFDLQTTPLAAYEEDVVRGEPGIRQVLGERGRTPRWFRHPFTHTGPSLEVRRSFEVFLAGRGYEVAPFSVENADYLFDQARRDARERGDEGTARRLLEAYVEHTLGAVRFCEDLSRQTFGREIPQVLLVHANGTNADAFGEVLDRLSERGYRFVTLAWALQDEAWQTPDEYVGRVGPSWLHRFRLARGLPVELQKEPDPPAWVLDLYRAARERNK
jgi:peptidoglycan/xylan/chitin deacetylase (PgdA/CDA1 family)